MKSALVILYVTISIMLAGWADAMDRAYGVQGAAPRSLFTTLFVWSIWPIALPIVLSTMVYGGGRWSLQSKR